MWNKWIAAALVAGLALTGCSMFEASTYSGDPKPRIYPAPVAQVYPQAVAAVASLQWSVVESNAEAGLIQAVTRQSMTRNPARVTIAMRQEDGQTRVDAACAAQQINAAEEFIEQFMARLDGMMQSGQ